MRGALKKTESDGIMEICKSGASGSFARKKER